MICDQAEYSETESKQPATETWSMARLDSSVFDHGGKMYQLLITTEKCRKMQKEKKQLEKLVSPPELFAKNSLRIFLVGFSKLPPKDRWPNPVTKSDYSSLVYGQWIGGAFNSSKNPKQLFTGHIIHCLTGRKYFLQMLHKVNSTASYSYIIQPKKLWLNITWH